MAPPIGPTHSRTAVDGTRPANTPFAGTSGSAETGGAVSASPIPGNTISNVSGDTIGTSEAGADHAQEDTQTPTPESNIFRAPFEPMPIISGTGQGPVSDHPDFTANQQGGGIPSQDEPDLGIGTASHYESSSFSEDQNRTRNVETNGQTLDQKAPFSPPHEPAAIGIRQAEPTPGIDESGNGGSDLNRQRSDNADTPLSNAESTTYISGLACVNIG